MQVYVGKQNSKLVRALKELKGFKKIQLKPGESRKVQIEIPISHLDYYDTNISDWRLELGAYNLFIGTASDQIFKTIPVKIRE